MPKAKPAREPDSMKPRMKNTAMPENSTNSRGFTATLLRRLNSRVRPAQINGRLAAREIA